MYIKERLRRLEDLIAGSKPPEQSDPEATLKRVETVLEKAFRDLPERLKTHAQRIFQFGETKTAEDAKTMLGNIWLARKLKGRNS